MGFKGSRNDTYAASDGCLKMYGKKASDHGGVRKRLEVEVQGPGFGP